MKNTYRNTGYKESLLLEKTYAFAVRVVKMCRYLNEEKREFLLSKQILRSGTNPGAMLRESRYAESVPDFIHKLSVARKETAETTYWLDLLSASGYINEAEHVSMSDEAHEIGKMLTAAIKTAKSRL